jgi:ribosomal protein L11 methyltransferase
MTMSEIGSGIWQATVRLGDGPVAEFIDILDPESAGISVFETERDNPAAGWTITALYRSPPDAAALTARLALVAASLETPEPTIELAPLPPADWLAQAYEGFPARTIGRFHVHGSHLPPPAGGVIGLCIDAATAFGSGEHQTTEGCLLALTDLAKSCPPISRVLDMGTGSGILAIAAAKLFPRAQIVAIDIDAESARVAAANAQLNGVASHIRVAQGNGYASPLAARGAKFDLIIANILARPLVRMAPSLGRRLKPGGTAILSGLLRRQERAVISAHRAAGLRLVARKPIGEWHTLIMRHK